jgi:hypothetical protein
MLIHVKTFHDSCSVLQERDTHFFAEKSWTLSSWPEGKSTTNTCFFPVHHQLENLSFVVVISFRWTGIRHSPQLCRAMTVRVLFLIPRSFHNGGALNYSTAPHRSKTTLISNGVFCLLESKILSIGQTLLHSLAVMY